MNVKAATKTAPARPAVVPRRPPTRKFPPQKPGTPNVVPFKRPGSTPPTKQPPKPVQPAPARKPGNKPGLPPKPGEPQRIWKPKYPEPRKPTPTPESVPVRKNTRSHNWNRKAIPEWAIGPDGLGGRGISRRNPSARASKDPPGYKAPIYNPPDIMDIHRWNLESIQADRTFRQQQFQRKTHEQVIRDNRPYGPPQQTAQSIKMNMRNYLERLSSVSPQCKPIGGMVFASHHKWREVPGSPVPPDWFNPTGAEFRSVVVGGGYGDPAVEPWILESGYGDEVTTITEARQNFWDQRFNERRDPVRKIVHGNTSWEEPDNKVSLNGVDTGVFASDVNRFPIQPIHRWVHESDPSQPPYPWRIGRFKISQSSTNTTPGRSSQYYDGRTGQTSVLSEIALPDAAGALQSGYTVLEWGIGTNHPTLPGDGIPDERWRFRV